VTISLRGVRYRYAGSSRNVLDGIDLDIAPGEVLGLVGANESGKTTLCLVASGLAPVAIGGHLEGTVTIDGTPTIGLRTYELAQRTGILFQDPLTQLSGTALTVFEEVAFGPRNLGLPAPEVMRRSEWALGALGASDLASRDPGRLSGGQAQLVALASVLALRPAHLVLDEPTSELDPHGTTLVGDALAKLASETGAAVLVVEHKTWLLARLAHRVAVLDGGRIMHDGPASVVLEDPTLAALGVDLPPRVSLRLALEAARIPIDPEIRAALALP
jgi:energy-coupling factor transporter ATP-binding protein EcfA2